MKYRKKSKFARHNFILLIILVTFISFGVSNINKASFANDANKTYEELLSAGLILNHTMTPIGGRFYKDFVAQWEAPPNIEQYTAVITERFNPQWGSMVWISIDDETVFQHSLSGRNVDMEELAQQAIQAVRQYLFTRELLRKFQKSSDLYGDGY